MYVAAKGARAPDETANVFEMLKMTLAKVGAKSNAFERYPGSAMINDFSNRQMSMMYRAAGHFLHISLFSV